MNDNDFNNEQAKYNTYRATTNLNTAIENPQMNMNSAVGVNIKNLNSNDYSSFSNNGYDSQNMNSDNGQAMTNYSANSFGQQTMNSPQANVAGSAYSDNSSQQYFANNNMQTPMVDSSYSTNSFAVDSSQTQFIPNNPNEGMTNMTNTQVEQAVYEPTMQEKREKEREFLFLVN